MCTNPGGLCLFVFSSYGTEKQTAKIAQKKKSNNGQNQEMKMNECVMNVHSMFQFVESTAVKRVRKTPADTWLLKDDTHYVFKLGK